MEEMGAEGRGWSAINYNTIRRISKKSFSEKKKENKAINKQVKKK